MSALKNPHKCMEVYYTQYNIITYIHITHIYRFHLSVMNSEIPFALDGLVPIIWKSETEELEDCGVGVEVTVYEGQSKSSRKSSADGEWEIW